MRKESTSVFPRGTILSMGTSYIGLIGSKPHVLHANMIFSWPPVMPVPDQLVTCRAQDCFRRDLWLPIAHDVLSIHRHRGSLVDLAFRRLPEREVGPLVASERRVQARLVAAKKTGYDRLPVSSLVPRELLREVFVDRAKVSMLLLKEAMESPWWSLRSSSYDLVAARFLSLCEEAGIRVELRDARPGAFVEQLRKHEEDGFVRPRYCVSASTTGRMGTEEGSPTVMSWPKNDRHLLVSRFEGGKILSLDFNAIDYRNIVGAVPELVEVYRGCEDFHFRTAEIVLGRAPTSVERSLVKQVTYIRMYGGSLSTVVAASGISLESAQHLLARMEQSLSAVDHLRQCLRVMDGHLIVHGQASECALAIPVEPGAKLLPLFAQGSSSVVFKAALGGLLERLGSSVPIMTVHDEVVIDLHPSDFGHVSGMIAALENAASLHHPVGFRVKARWGTNYGELLPA